MGLSPLHIKRPSFIVVLNLMNTFVLDPDTLFNVEEGNTELGQSSFKKNIKDDAVFLLRWSCALLSCNSPTRWVCGTLVHIPTFSEWGNWTRPTRIPNTIVTLLLPTNKRKSLLPKLSVKSSPKSKFWEHPVDLVPSEASGRSVRRAN